MVRQTRAAVAAALTLVTLTGCGGATAEATPSHVYSPLPPFTTATPTKSPSPEASSSPSATPSPSPTAASSEAAVAGAQGGTAELGAPAQPSVPEGAVVQIPVPAPVAGSGAIGGDLPVQATERTSSSTTTTTSTTLEARVSVVVTCEGQCMLDDLSAPELTGEDGPIAPDLLQRALEEELSRQSSDRPLVTDDLTEQLTRADWELADRFLQGGQEKLIFSSARK
ncbi:hypothetical protein [Kocuria rosea]|uniref:hypothetical protein n=1 Tax=Kocuria rosea TaxID=1275 RepID=UPI002040499A|nr:hypothetical protein [Kocuria rosea]MCM3688708.1 hypothetical protein [Kocuria rosea]